MHIPILNVNTFPNVKVQEQALFYPLCNLCARIIMAQKQQIVYLNTMEESLHLPPKESLKSNFASRGKNLHQLMP